MVIAALGQRWFGDQFINNTVVVQQGLNGEVFVKLPDGSYNPPPGNAARLTTHADGTYRYETLNRALLAFNSAGKLATYTHPSGVQAAFTYSGANLTQVANSLGRVLSFTYSGARISAVGDGTRSIGYAYDASGNLTSYTDATAQTTRVRQLRSQVLVFARSHFQKCHYNSANCSGAAGFSIPNA